MEASLVSGSTLLEVSSQENKPPNAELAIFVSDGKLQTDNAMCERETNRARIGEEPPAVVNITSGGRYDVDHDVDQLRNFLTALDMTLPMPKPELEVDNMPRIFLNVPLNTLTATGEPKHVQEDEEDVSSTVCVRPSKNKSIFSKPVKQLKRSDSLEALHDMIPAICLDIPVNNAALSLPTYLTSLVAKVWVVRYVDYTSKYGLGFLFNTGNAGVYFNDSTKMVLSADGTVFQFTERRRDTGVPESTHVSQQHRMTAYPPELQKKVALLKHFTNYLLDQHQQNSDAAKGSGEEDNGEGFILEGGIKNVTEKGASYAVKFGQSSTRFNSVAEHNLPTTQDTSCVNANQDMPFLKKWVRTKHAILFRISNRTVQVVFYDRSEVLLSSEARVITYVSKQGQRSEHTLDDVLSLGRMDIAKRLKYTKDIMYRLIGAQSK